MNATEADAPLVKATYREEQMLAHVRNMHAAGWVIAELSAHSDPVERSMEERIVWRKP